MEKNLGHATAYGYAKSKGYSGTEDEFAELMADYASVGQSAAQSAEQAAASATSASGSAATASQAAQTATSKASEAVTAAETATTKASEASTSASTASSAATSAGASAQTATTAATTATEKASEASESATTATTAKTDAETARDAAAQSASEAAESARTLTIDATLTQSGQAADAKAVGDEIDSLKSDLNKTDKIVGMPIATEISYGSSNFTIGIYKTADIGSIPTFSTASSSCHLRIPVTDNLKSVSAHLTMYNVAYACPIVYVNSNMEVTGYVVASDSAWHDYIVASDDIPVGTTEILVQAYLTTAQTRDDLSAVKVITTQAESGLSVDVAALQRSISGSTTTSTTTYAHSDSVAGIYKQNGYLSSQGDRFVIPAAGLATLTATTKQANLTYAWPIVFMDENMNITGHIEAPSAAAWNDYNVLPDSIPSQTAYVLVQRYGGDDSADTMVATATYAITIPSVGDRLNALEANNKIIDVIIFMGQSNMAGRGITSETWPENAMAVDSGAGYEFRAISDPLMLHSIDEAVRAFGYAENASGKINDGTRKTGGPVPAFINAYYVATGVPVVGVSASEGGTTISQWQPGGARLTDAIDRLNGAVTFCTAKGYVIRHKYMVWCQGESDGDNETTASEYATNFESMLSAMLNAGIEKCFLIRIGNYNSPNSLLYKAIMDKQTEIAQNNMNVVMVSTDLAGFRDRGLMKDQFHYYQKAYNEFGTYAGTNAGFYAKLGKEPTMYDPASADLYYTHKN